LSSTVALPTSAYAVPSWLEIAYLSTQEKGG
jgi:hypothetical protein